MMNVKIGQTQYMNCSTRMWVYIHINYRNSKSLMDVICPFRSGSCLLIRILSCVHSLTSYFDDGAKAIMEKLHMSLRCCCWDM